MRDWLTILSAGLLTYATRASFLVLGDRVKLPDAVGRSLRYVAPAAFAGIAVPAVVSDEAGLDLAQIVAATVAAAVAWKTRNLVASMVCGMVSLWLLQWVGM